MKKLVLMAVAVAAVSFASCGGNKSNNAEQATENQTEAVEAAEEVVPAESIEADSTATATVDEAAETAAEGEEVAQ